MWVLLYFPKEKKSSIVKESLILPQPNGKKPNPGDEVLVRWNSSKHRAKLLRYSSTKVYLEKLHVDAKTGEITAPQQVKPTKSKNQNTVDRQQILKCRRESDQSKAFTQKKHDKFLLEKMDGLLQASGGASEGASSGATSGGVSGGEELLVETDNGANFTQTQKEETNGHVEKETVTKSRRISDDLKNEDPDLEVDTTRVKKKQFCSLGESFSHLTVTPEIVRAFEFITNFLRAHLKAQIVPQNLQVLSHNTETATPSWRLPGAEKVQLGSKGVWVDSGQLQILTSSWRQNPNELARRLFKWLVGEPALATMCALGGGANKEAMDPLLRTTVAAYVEKVTGNRIEVNRLINLMCGKLAAKYGVALTKSGKRKLAPNHQEKPTTNERGSAKTSGKTPRQTTVTHHEKTTRIETSEVENSDPESFNKSSVSARSGDFSIDLVDHSREKEMKKTSTPTKTKPGKIRKKSSSQIFRRRSSSSFDKSIDGMSPIKSKKNKSAENNTTDAGVASEPRVSTDLQAFSASNQENLTGPSPPPPPTVLTQQYLPEIQKQWEYSHFGYQHPYPTPPPQYAHYLNHTGNINFPSNTPHHQTNYFGSVDQLSNTCEPASTTYAHL